jgi:hypothetical protein
MVAFDFAFATLMSFFPVPIVDHLLGEQLSGLSIAIGPISG